MWGKSTLDEWKGQILIHIQQRLLEFEKKKKIYHSCNIYLIKPQQWKDHLAMKIKWGDIDKSFEHDIARAQLTFLKS